MGNIRTSIFRMITICKLIPISLLKSSIAFYGIIMGALAMYESKIILHHFLNSKHSLHKVLL